METLNFFNIDFNNYHNKYLSLAYCYRNDVALLEKFEANGVSTFSFKKILLLAEYSLYVSLQKKIHAGAKIFQLLQYLVATYFIYIIAEDFSYDLLQVSESKVLDIFTDHVQMINKSGSLIDHICIKKNLMKEFETNGTVENIYFLDHDAVRVIIEKWN